MALRSGPDAIENAVFAILAQVVSVAISQEATIRLRIVGPLEFADRRLMIGHTQVFGPELRRHTDWHSGPQRDIDVPLVGALGMHIDVDFSAALRDRFEQGLPEIVTSVGNSALAMYAKTKTCNCRACFQQPSKSVTAVACMRLRCQTCDLVVGRAAPFIRMRPQTQIEL